MKNWKNTLIPPKATILEALEIINKSAYQIAIVVDSDFKLLGTITDGDIRRAILANKPMTEYVENVMRRSPIVASKLDSKDKRISLMTKNKVSRLPIVDDANKLIELYGIEDAQSSDKENWVVLMAGGSGTRLRPLTEECPKPLLKVGTRPILETIIQNFQNYGFKRFFISINYKGEMLESYFGDGSKWGVQIEYIREKDHLGTAGALSLLPNQPHKPIIVMNGDILTKINFDNLLEFHELNKSAVTMCVRQYDFQVPYGVLELDNSVIKKISEKPIHNFFVNAGIYVLNPESLNLIPNNQTFHMTNLFDKCIEKNLKSLAFPIHEYWLDIGQIDDFKRANGEFGQYFGE